MNTGLKRVAVLGASRGLGRATVNRLIASGGASALFVCSRKKQLLEEIANEPSAHGISIDVFSADFSKAEEQNQVIDRLSQWNPDTIIYCAGGGPHGVFADKEWKDHLWAWNVSFLFPARLIHMFLPDKSVEKMIFVGSAIAESDNNALSASYGSSKAALLSLVRAVQNGLSDVRLFSPGYMNTEMLPPNALPRKQGVLLDPQNVAKVLLAWLDSPKDSDKESWHKTL